LRKSHDNQVDNLVSQLNEMKIKMKNSETLREDIEIELNNKLASLQELFYAKLYEIKDQHEQVLHFIAQSQTQFEKQKEAQSSFDIMKVWEASRTIFPTGKDKGH
jgi:hypothetical protein